MNFFFLCLFSSIILSQQCGINYYGENCNEYIPYGYFVRKYEDEDCLTFLGYEEIFVKYEMPLDVLQSADLDIGQFECSIVVEKFIDFGINGVDCRKRRRSTQCIPSNCRWELLENSQVPSTNGFFMVLPFLVEELPEDRNLTVRVVSTIKSKCPTLVPLQIEDQEVIPDDTDVPCIFSNETGRVSELFLVLVLLSLCVLLFSV